MQICIFTNEKILLLTKELLHICIFADLHITLHGHKDSNPDQRFWRPVCYRCTMPVNYKILKKNFLN